MDQSCPFGIPKTQHGVVWFRNQGGERTRLKVLDEKKDEFRMYRLSITTNHMTAFLEYEIFDRDFLPDCRELELLLNKNEIHYGIDRECLRMLIRLLGEGNKRVGPILVAAGLPPIPGENGTIDFLIKPSSETARYTPDESGKINYHETNLIENALAEHDIAMVRPPSKGEDGITIYGKKIVASPGKPLNVRIGDNIGFNPQSGLCTAKIDGRLMFDGHTLSLTEKYSINSDVDLSVGDVNFVGSVDIHGQVLDGFSIKGRKEVYIGGTVGACNVWSEGDVSINGGAIGKGTGEIISEKGSIRARYLKNLLAQAKGDIIIQNEIVGCKVMTMGALFIEKGSILGGETNAFRGIVAEKIGSSLGIDTSIVVGTTWYFEEQMAKIRKAISKVDLYLQKLSEEVSPIAGKANRIKDYPKTEHHLIQDVATQIKNLRTRKEELNREYASILAESRKSYPRQINVMEMVYPGVRIRLGEIMVQIRKPHKGPLTIIPDSKGISVRLVEMKKFPVKPAGK
ncbi:MAG: DUF342 domain-containing protein [Planctomycetes bacterium]|nr:DUF342 domain-containing protein [Planctomycetota bacterium]